MSLGRPMRSEWNIEPPGPGKEGMRSCGSCILLSVGTSMNEYVMLCPDPASGQSTIYIIRSILDSPLFSASKGR